MLAILRVQPGDAERPINCLIGARVDANDRISPPSGRLSRDVMATAMSASAAAAAAA